LPAQKRRPLRRVADLDDCESERRPRPTGTAADLSREPDLQCIDIRPTFLNPKVAAAREGRTVASAAMVNADR